MRSEDIFISSQGIFRCGHYTSKFHFFRVLHYVTLRYAVCQKIPETSLGPSSIPLSIPVVRGT